MQTHRERSISGASSSSTCFVSCKSIFLETRRTSIIITHMTIFVGAVSLVVVHSNFCSSYFKSWECRLIKPDKLSDVSHSTIKSFRSDLVGDEALRAAKLRWHFYQICSKKRLASITTGTPTVTVKRFELARMSTGFHGCPRAKWPKSDRALG